jgi:hypothetical protein
MTVEEAAMLAAVSPRMASCPRALQPRRHGAVRVARSKATSQKQRLLHRTCRAFIPDARRRGAPRSRALRHPKPCTDSATEPHGRHGGTCFDCGRRQGVARPSTVGHITPVTGAPQRPDAAADGGGARTGPSQADHRNGTAPAGAPSTGCYLINWTTRSIIGFGVA